MNLERALAIAGWMEPDELEWLANHAAAKPQVICEVGCWLGRSTRAFADNIVGSILAVDTWNGSEEHQKILKYTSKDWIYETFCHNLQDKIKDFTVEVFRMTSLEAAAKFKGHIKFDIVFIDAAHDYESVRADILAWKPLVVPSGILCGHDAGCPPVMQATHELLPDVRHEGSMWVVNL